jgi:hypothetical protein
MCAVSLLVALLLAWPTPLLYGVDNVPTGFHNLHGYRCLAEDINPIYITTFLIVLWPLSIAMAIKADVEATLAKYMTNLNILQKISEG